MNLVNFLLFCVGVMGVLLIFAICYIFKKEQEIYGLRIIRNNYLMKDRTYVNAFSDGFRFALKIDKFFNKNHYIKKESDNRIKRFK